MGDMGSRNSAMEAVSEALTVVRDIAASNAPDDQDRRSLGVRCRNAVKRLVNVRQSNLPEAFNSRRSATRFARRDADTSC